jgi:hypothetical protein
VLLEPDHLSAGLPANGAAGQPQRVVVSWRATGKTATRVSTRLWHCGPHQFGRRLRAAFWDWRENRDTPAPCKGSGVHDSAKRGGFLRVASTLIIPQRFAG